MEADKQNEAVPAVPAAPEAVGKQPAPANPKGNAAKNTQPKAAKKSKDSKGPITLPPAPEYIQERLKIWEALKEKLQQSAASGAAISITLPDGAVKTGEAGKTTPLDIVKGISKRLAEDAIIAKVNDTLWDLHRPFEADSTLEIKTFNDPEGKKVFWHSSAHILGQSMELLYGCKLTIGPPLADGGFYYDAAMDGSVSSEDFGAIQKIVADVVSQKQTFERLFVPKEDALEMFKYNKFKVELINKKVADGDSVSMYRCGPLIDLCKGPHIPDTGKVKAFHVWKNSSSNWLGDVTKDSLQRVYGISFPSDKLLKEWQTFQEEAAKRDHRNIGKNQELFFFHPLSPGSCFFLPHGARLYNKLVEFIRNEYRKRGYTEVVTPNMYNAQLWEASGHWANYKDNMFTFEVEKQQFALKPMNCPGHCLMFQHRTRSYRELPIRLADFGVLHRNEISGALTGLTRVRRFQQDDAHIFCTPEQIKNEIRGVLDFMKTVYGIFGYTFALELSTRPENFLGEVEVWNNAEKQLEEVLTSEFGPTGWKLNPGDGAFYGPKIDIHISDALKRSFQCATIQLDFQLPIRFDLQYQTPEGDLKRPVIIHRAILGSVERHLGILIEHTAGKWPFWLSPRQAVVINVSESQAEYSRKVHRELHDAGFYVDLNASDDKLGKKIRDSQLAQYNFILVIGDKEVQTETVNIRTRDDNKELGQHTIPQVLELWNKLTEEHK